MAYIPRQLEVVIRSRLFSGKAIVLYGPRQSGKTTMLRRLTEGYASDLIWLNGDSPDVRALLEEITVAKWKTILGGKKLVVIDEAQRVANIGLSIKLLADECPDVQVMATGSSAFDLAQRTSEPLTGRKFEYLLPPLSFAELCAHHGLLEEKRALEHRLLYGAYPEIVTCEANDVKERLAALADSYLYKDVLMMEGLKKPSLLEKLTRALALQLGAEVSASELSRLVGADNKTVEKYLDVLEKCYVIFRLPAFSRNERTEIRKGRKIYFYDLGIRNAVLGNFLPLEARTDVGGLWENYLVLERIKRDGPNPFPPRRYFWRTTAQREVDYVEETENGLAAWEFKWGAGSLPRFPLAFRRAYADASTGIVTPENCEAFLQ